MRGLRKALGVLNDILDLGIVLVALMALAVSSYTLYDICMLYKAADNEALVRYKPGSEAETEEEGEGGELLDACVAWLSVEDTKIDFPVMQGETNVEFLNKDPFGNYSLAGSIFIDSRNSPSLEDGYLLIYGHHMSGDAMFGTLDHYLEEGYMEEHKGGVLIRKDGKEFPFRIFAVMCVEATEPLIFSPEQSDTDKILSYVRESALFWDERAAPSEQIVALTTCKYPDTTLRTVVLGYLLSPGAETEQEANPG